MIAYRPDIDGLRSLAILPVIFFHAGFSVFSGGFIGVDIFFVISGFLITSIIANAIKTNQFTLSDFYERRIRRILPVFFVILVTTLITGCFILLPDDLKRLGRDAATTIIFLSNFRFWKKTGYFDETAIDKPLLHTWSLSVEEQFYITFPILLILLYKFAPHREKLVIWSLFILSFIFSVLMLDHSPRTSFYMLPARAWELLLGSILALNLIPKTTSKTLTYLLSLAGTSMILGAIFLIDEHLAFPGYNALYPTLGTALIIYAGASFPNNIVSSVLASKPFVSIGKISFSLYLWHWPVITFYYYVVNRPTTLEEGLWLVALSIILSIFTYFLVERPFRQRKILADKSSLFKGAFASIILTGLVVGGLQVGVGLYSTLPDKVARLIAGSKDGNPDRNNCFDRTSEMVTKGLLCQFGSTEAKEKILIWGDSHADAFMPGLVSYAEKQNFSGLFIGRNTCLPIIGAWPKGDNECRELNDATIKFLHDEDSISRIYMIGRWALNTESEGYGEEKIGRIFLENGVNKNYSSDKNIEIMRQGLKKTLSSIEKMGKKVIIVAQIPEVGFDVPKRLARSALAGKDLEVGPSLEEYLSRNKNALEILIESSSQYKNTSLMLPHEVLCKTGRCKIKKDGYSLYKDDDHINATGSRFILKLLHETRT